MSLETASLVAAAAAFFAFSDDAEAGGFVADTAGTVGAAGAGVAKDAEGREDVGLAGLSSSKSRSSSPQSPDSAPPTFFEMEDNLEDDEEVDEEVNLVGADLETLSPLGTTGLLAITLTGFASNSSTSKSSSSHPPPPPPPPPLSSSLKSVKLDLLVFMEVDPPVPIEESFGAFSSRSPQSSSSQPSPSDPFLSLPFLLGLL